MGPLPEASGDPLHSGDMKHPHPFSPLALLLGLWLVSGTAAPADEKPAQRALEQLAAAEASYVADLDALAGEAAKRLAYKLRDEIFEHLLLFRPDHEDARRWLKYKRDDESGEWVRKSKYRRPRNSRAKAARELTERFRERFERFLLTDVSGVLAEVDTAAACPALEQALYRLRDIEQHRLAVIAADGAPIDDEAERPKAELVPRVRKAFRLHRYQLARTWGAAGPYRAARNLLRTAYPEDAEVRKTIGEVKNDKGAWVLAATVRGMAQRKAWIALRKRLAEQGPAPKPVPLDGDEIGASMPGMLAVKTKHIRVTGTGEVKRLARIAQDMEVAGPMFKAIVGRAPKRREGMTAFAFALPEEIDTFLERYPKSRPELLAARKKLGLDITWMDGRRMVVRDVPEDAQVDLCMGLLLRMFVSDTYTWKGVLPGWIDEGLSRYITFRTSGTRLSIAVAGRYKPAGGTGRNVPGSKDKWLLSARAYAKGLNEKRLHLVLGQSVEAYTAPQAVMAYALCTYLAECHPGSLDKILELRAKNTGLDQTIRATTGLPLGVMLVEWQQWLNETEPE